MKRQRRRWLNGPIPEVVREIEELCGPRCGSVLTRERGYFRRNITAGRRDYHRLAETNWPIGSGAMDSAIGRVINLRLKAAGVFWHQDSAEAVLILRA